MTLYTWKLSRLALPTLLICWVSANAQVIDEEKASAATPQVISVKKGSASSSADTKGSGSGSCDECKNEAGDGKKKEEPKNPWEKIPPVRVFPRQGYFPILPSGPGYYSLHDAISGNYREKPPNQPYPAFALMSPSFFDADFRYLESPKNEQHDLFDPLHRMHLGDNWLFNTGGSVWWRHMREINSRLSGRNNEYDLTRARLYGDLWYNDKFRAYVEFIAAHSFNEDMRPLPIDENHADLLNAFIDMKLFDLDDYAAYLRIGRQELLLGSQRLISPLEWANTRRTFQGVRAFRQGEKFDVDLFWVQPVIPDPSNFDSVDNNQNLAGLWTTYRPEKGHFVDFYYLFLDNTNRSRRLGLVTAPFNVHTLGTRYTGDKNNFLWDAEFMLQMGEHARRNTLAGAATVGAGYNFKECPLNPTFWAYYDWASGDRNPGPQGTYNTFNQLFAFGHYYMGWADIVGRQNIQDLNFHMYLYPTKWVTFWTQYHHFWLDNSRDALYSPAGIPTRRSAGGRFGGDVGNEIDFTLNFHLGTHSDILLGYSKLFGGNFLDRSGIGGSPELFYAQYNLRW